MKEESCRKKPPKLSISKMIKMWPKRGLNLVNDYESLFLLLVYSGLNVIHIILSGAALVACSVLKAMSSIADDDEELELSIDLLDHAK